MSLVDNRETVGHAEDRGQDEGVCSDQEVDDSELIQKQIDSVGGNIHERSLVRNLKILAS